MIEKLESVGRKRESVWLTHALVLRPAIWAFGLLLFMIFDERGSQFIYFQF